MQGARFTRQAYYAFITSRQTGEMQCAAKHAQKSRKPQGLECNRPHLLLNEQKKKKKPLTLVYQQNTSY